MKRLLALAALPLAGCCLTAPRVETTPPGPPPSTAPLRVIKIVDCLPGYVLTVVDTCVLPAVDPSEWDIGEADPGETLPTTIP